MGDIVGGESAAAIAGADGQEDTNREVHELRHLGVVAVLVRLRVRLAAQPLLLCPTNLTEVQLSAATRSF